MPYSSLLAWASFITTAAAQAPVSDLTGYPSGLASIAVVGYYAVSSDKNVLPHRRRVAGMGMEHIARDCATGPRKGKDAHLKGIVISRQSERHQRSAWARVMCGKSSDVNGVTGVHFLDGDEITRRCAKAFVDLPLDIQNLLEDKVSWGDEGHWLAAAGAFCQVVKDLPDGARLLHQCQQHKNNWDAIVQAYHSLRTFVEGRTNTVEMPSIEGLNITTLEELMLRVDTWEEGGRPVYISVYKFLRIIGHCVGFSYGELMLGAHAHLKKCPWAAVVYVEFPSAIETTTSLEAVISEVETAIGNSCFLGRECDLRVWGHRFGDTCASLVSGCIIAALVSLGSTAGSWVAVTAAAVADPKPVAGLTCASWGYPAGRRSHMEARSRPIHGHASVCLKRNSWLISFNSTICQDIVWQSIVGLVSIFVLSFKFTLRSNLGFGKFDPPAPWIFWTGVAFAGLGILISAQIPLWARNSGGRWSMLHGIAVLSVAASNLGFRIAWREGTTPALSIRSFWVSDACVWLYCVAASWFSVHLGESTEYPVTGWIWPSLWMLVLASCGAGVPRAVPAR